MDYGEWIERERRVRLAILQSSPEIDRSGRYRVCEACDEVLLCHEEKCPNCDSVAIVARRLDPTEVESGRWIRCQRRFEGLRRNEHV